MDFSNINFKKILYVSLIALIIVTCLAKIAKGGCNETQVYNYYNYSNSTSELYLTNNITITRTCTPDIDSGAPVAVTIFILSMVFSLFALPLVIKRFSHHELLDQLLKRLCWLVALFLLILVSVMILTIAENANLGLFNEIFRFTWILMWGCYLFIVWLILSFFFNVIGMWGKRKREKRMGEGGDEE